MLMIKERRPSWREVERWAICVLLEEGAIKQCPDHGYIQCRSDPDAQARAFQIAREHPPAGLALRMRWRPCTTFLAAWATSVPSAELAGD
jgi:hypothetical protein